MELLTNGSGMLNIAVNNLTANSFNLLGGGSFTGNSLIITIGTPPNETIVTILPGSFQVNVGDQTIPELTITEASLASSVPIVIGDTNLLGTSYQLPFGPIGLVDQTIISDGLGGTHWGSAVGTTTIQYMNCLMNTNQTITDLTNITMNQGNTSANFPMTYDGTTWTAISPCVINFSAIVVATLTPDESSQYIISWVKNGSGIGVVMLPNGTGSSGTPMNQFTPVNGIDDFVAGDTLRLTVNIVTGSPVIVIGANGRTSATLLQVASAAPPPPPPPSLYSLVVDKKSLQTLTVNSYNTIILDNIISEVDGPAFVNNTFTAPETGLYRFQMLASAETTTPGGSGYLCGSGIWWSGYGGLAQGTISLSSNNQAEVDVPPLTSDVTLPLSVGDTVYTTYIYSSAADPLGMQLLSGTSNELQITQIQTEGTTLYRLSVYKNPSVLQTFLVDGITRYTVQFDTISYQANGTQFATNTFTCGTAGTYRIDALIGGNLNMTPPSDRGTVIVATGYITKNALTTPVDLYSFVSNTSLTNGSTTQWWFTSIPLYTTATLAVNDTINITFLPQLTTTPLFSTGQFRGNYDVTMAIQQLS